MNKQAYVQGFVDACNAQGIDGIMLAKQAGLLDDASAKAMEVGSKIRNTAGKAYSGVKNFASRGVQKVNQGIESIRASRGGGDLGGDFRAAARM